MNPLKFAKGSVRAILAFSWSAAIIAFAFIYPDKVVWEAIFGVGITIVAFYFGTRSQDQVK